MSPVGDDFTRRIRMFPGLVSCTTIDWFMDWPVEALVEVGTKFLEEEHNLSDPAIKASSKVVRVRSGENKFKRRLNFKV